MTISSSPVPLPPRRFFCYLLECADGTYYTGWTTDPQRRLEQHNRGRGARYTRARLPVRLVYVEELPSQTAAMKRERAIKSLSHRQKQELTCQNQSVKSGKCPNEMT
jgi:putative endonuclease